MLHGSQAWGGKGLGRPRMKHENRDLGASWFPSVGWEGSGQVQNEASEKGWWVLHGSQEWGGKDGNFCCWRFRWSTKAIAAALDPTPFNET